ncbi:MAG: hypothetical protein CMA12_08530 [Euryarchaeota archaeon]|nr:hypothetical protein [Euryarchaeota archaeon]
MDIKLKIDLLIKENNFFEAEKICKKQIKKNKNDLYFYKVIAMIYWKNKSYDNVIEILKNYLEIDFNNKIIHNSIGLAYLEIFNYEKAIQYFQKAININSSYIDAYNNLGIANQKLGNFEISIDFFKKVITIDKDFYQAYNNLGVTYFQLGDINKSEEFTKSALLIRPDYLDANLNLANIYIKEKIFDKALIYLERSLKINPKDENTILNIAKIYVLNKKNNKAISYLKEFININKNCISIIFLCDLLNKEKKYNEAEKIIKEYLVDNKSSEGFNILGQIKFNQKNYIKAEHFFNLSHEYDDANVNPIYNLGYLNQEEGDFKKAEYFYKLVLDKDQSHYDTINNYYEILCLKKEYEIALNHLFNCLKKNENKHIINNNIGIVYKNKGDIELARKYFRYSIDLKKTYEKPYFNLASIDYDLKNFLEAKLNFQKALEIDSNFQLARYGLMKCLSYLCLWDEYNENIQFLDNLGIKEEALPPLGLLSMQDDPERELLRAVKWSSKLEKIHIEIRENEIRRNNVKIKIGFFSSDFREHPVMFLLSNFFKKINRNIFEVYAYYNSPFKYDSYTYDVINNVDVFDDLSKFDDDDAIKRIKENNLDIAIDLNGHTQFNRYELFVHSLAPVQITYLGYPGTSGGKCFDYIVADKVVIPPNNKQYFSEEVLYLPSCFMCTDDNRKIAQKFLTKKENSLPEDSFVYACFNSTYKITNEEFDIWMGLLKEVDKSVLWLRSNSNIWKKNFKKRVIKNGIDSERIIFADNQPIDIHIARHKAADLFLDTFNYNAHSTAADILWAGKPIVTLCGKSFSSRVCSSLLKGIGMEELIAYDKKNYKQLALNLSNDIKLLKEIERKINTNIKKSDLFNSQKFVDNFETMLLSIHKDDSYKL